MMILAPLLLLQTVGPHSGVTLPKGERPPNVLILLADDLGTDQVAAYGEGASPPWMPNVDALAQDGVLFRNAYGNPYCSPTRAALLTGRHAFRTGIGSYMTKPDLTGFALQPSEITLPELLQLGPHRYATAAIGKWHLGNGTVGGADAPNLAGFAHFAGAEGNLTGPETYEKWIKWVDGQTSLSWTYATTDNVDDALEFVADAPEPWFLYVAFNAVHVPLHVPPAGMYVVDIPPLKPHGDGWPYYAAAAEAMDLEIGRLLAGLGAERERTDVLFLGDNGSASGFVLPPIPPHQSKGQPYEGGIGVPLIYSGPSVRQPGRIVEALVQVTDVFATLAEVAGIDLASVLPPGHALDSISLMPYLADPGAPPLRATAYSEFFSPNGFGPYDMEFRTIRDQRYKLIVELGKETRLFDLLVDPYEQANLLPGTLTPEQQAALDALDAELAATNR